MINNIVESGKGKGESFCVKKVFGGKLGAGSDLSEEGFHYL